MNQWEFGFWERLTATAALLATFTIAMIAFLGYITQHASGVTPGIERAINLWTWALIAVIIGTFWTRPGIYYAVAAYRWMNNRITEDN